MLPIQSPNSLASQFDAVQFQATEWSFQTLLEWVSGAINTAHTTGALDKRGHDIVTHQLYNAAAKGREEILCLLWSWYAGATLSIERMEERVPSWEGTFM